MTAQTPPIPEDALLRASSEAPSDALEARVHRALRLWSSRSAESPLAGSQLLAQTCAKLGPHASPRSCTNEVLSNALDALSSIEPETAHLLRSRFCEGRSRSELAKKRSISVSHFDRLQRDAIHMLAAVIHSAERAATIAVQRKQSEQLATFLSHLDLFATYDILIGADALLSQLSSSLAQVGSPFMISVEGNGGIGKTSLAIAGVRAAVDAHAFARFAWVTAQERELLLSGRIRHLEDAATSADSIVLSLCDQLLGFHPSTGPFTLDKVLVPIRELTKSQRCLIVVDNIETARQLDTLLPILRSLCNPSKVMLTSRQQPDPSTVLYRIGLTELSESNALRLVRHQAAMANLPTLAGADDNQLQPIYQLAGGNPLALRLIVSQCRFHPLPVVLNDLLYARGRVADNLYTFVYRRAWEHLTEHDRQVLLAMPLLPLQGGSLTDVVEISGLEEQIVLRGLDSLVSYSLVDHHLDQLERSRYTIHSLTRSFLHTQVLRWK